MGYQRAEGVVYEMVDGKAMLVDLAGMELLTLNTVGTMVWGALPGFAEPGTLAGHLLPHLAGVDAAELEGDVRAFLDELAGLGLVVRSA